MVVFSDEIKQRIEETKKTYSKKDQRAELLKRNNIFSRELEELKSQIKEKCAGLDIKSIQKPGSFNDHPELLESACPNKKGHLVHPFIFFHEKFVIFCKRWNIYLDWNGEIESLGSHIKETPIIIYDHWAAGTSINFARTETLPMQDETYYIYLNSSVQSSKMKSLPSCT